MATKFVSKKNIDFLLYDVFDVEQLTKHDYYKEHIFMFKISAFPEEEIGTSFGEQGVQIKGIGESSVER